MARGRGRGVHDHEHVHVHTVTSFMASWLLVLRVRIYVNLGLKARHERRNALGSPGSFEGSLLLQPWGEVAKK